ncbi:MAG: M20/M25/M40 family metallo-hydrolase [Pseudomonadota bacterium]
MSNFSIRFAVVAMGCAVLASCAGLQSPMGLFTPSLPGAIKDHVEVLASDRIQGRATGSQGYAMSATYVADFFDKAGIAPGAPDYRQDVPLYAVNPSKVTGTLRLQGLEREEGEDVAFFPPLTNLGGDQTQDTQGAVVFVGHGIVAPELGLNAYKGVDVRGRIVLMLSGAPEMDDQAVQEHLKRLDTKRMEAGRQGAIGLLYADPDLDNVNRLARLRRSHLSGALVVEVPLQEALPVAAVSDSVVRELIEAAGRDKDEVIDAAQAGTGESFTTGVQAELITRAEARPVKSFNVVGIIPGTDASLQDEAVVVTAHLDHLGTRDLGDDRDGIYNGALDNAAGVAIVMEAAKQLATEGGARRTLIFAALTAEEAGLLGSLHLAASLEGMGYTPVANINIDMPVLTYPLNDVIGFGAEHSSLKRPLDEAAAEVGLVATPDPLPELSLFVRSDHYRFVQRGVPSVFLFNGMAGEGREAFQAFMRNHYHKPSDQVDLPINWSDAATFTELSVGLIRRVADAETAPTWNEGSPFDLKNPKD